MVFYLLELWDQRVSAPLVLDSLYSAFSLIVLHTADRDSVSPIKQPRHPGILSDQPETKWMASTRIIKPNTGFKSLLDANDTSKTFRLYLQIYVLNSDLYRA